MESLFLDDFFETQVYVQVRMLEQIEWENVSPFTINLLVEWLEETEANVNQSQQDAQSLKTGANNTSLPFIDFYLSASFFECFGHVTLCVFKVIFRHHFLIYNVI